MDKNIFRAYDIRGDVRTQLTPESVFIIGRALAAAHFPKGSTLVVGRDARTHSPILAENLMRGLRMQGVNIVFLGQITTPMLYFALFSHSFDGGVMITGSHNPVHDNGLKICRKTSSFLADDILAVQNMTMNLPAPAAVEGTFSELNISSEYESAILSRIPPAEKLKIVIDAGNGVAGPFAKSLFSHYASQLIELFCTPDGSFPNHHPDPSVAKNLIDLQQAVLDNHADIGLAFDGDGDRLGVVDCNGKIIEADRLIILFAREILTRCPKSVIIGDVKCSKIVFDDIEKNGGIPMMSKTGHALIKAKIRETKAALAGELSGHFFFSDRWYGFDDALNAAARILEIAASAKRHQKSLSDLLSDLPQSFATPEIRIECPDNIKFKLAQAMYEKYSKLYPTNDLDGARIDFADGWALIRASNTQPVLVLRAEAVSDSALHKILFDIEQDIEHMRSAEFSSFS